MCDTSLPELYLEMVVNYLTFFVEICALSVIMVGVLKTFYYFIKDLIKTFGSPAHQEKIRLQLGRSLGLGLEFLIAADILKTAVAPSWTKIGQLAAIIALRTALEFFLKRDIEQSEKRMKSRRN